MIRQLIFILCVGSFAAAQETVLIEHGGDMVYIANADSDPGVDAEWFTRDFDDSAWTIGTYGIGYGAGDLNSVELPDGTLSVYTRATFTITDPAAVENVYLGVDYDDAYVAWINGTEVQRDGILDDSPVWNSDTDGQHESSNDAPPDYSPLLNITDMAKPLLVAGENILAIGAWNEREASSDLALCPRLSINRQASTGHELCGDITADTTLTRADSPYILTCDLTVPEGVTLTIEAGVQIMGRSDAGLVVHGALRALGTAAEHVVFTHEDTGHWGGIEIDLENSETAADSTLTFVEIWYPGTALHITDTAGASILVEDCSFDFWSSVAVDWDDAPGLVVRRCDIGVNTPESEADQESVHGYRGGALVEYCTFGRRSANNDCVDLGDCDWADGKVPVIRYNTFLGGADDAIDFDGADGWIIGNLIMNFYQPPDSTGRANGGGITGSDANTVVMNNIVYNCYHGIGYKDGVEAYCINNTILDCHVGFTLYKESCSQDNSKAHIYNTIIWGSDPGEDGEPMNIILNGRWWPLYCQTDEVCGDISVSNCIVGGGWPDGTNILDTAPLLQNPADAGFAPLSGSPVIDAGYGGSMLPPFPHPDPERFAAQFNAYLAQDHGFNPHMDIPCIDDTGTGDITYRDIGAMEFQDAAICAGGAFVRSDANGDGDVDLSDAVTALLHLFGGRPTDCSDALDINDDGALTLADPIFLLTYLFAEGQGIPAPFPNAGIDPTAADALDCQR